MRRQGNGKPRGPCGTGYPKKAQPTELTIPTTQKQVTILPDNLLGLSTHLGIKFNIDKAYSTYFVNFLKFKGSWGSSDVSGHRCASFFLIEV